VPEEALWLIGFTAESMSEFLLLRISEKKYIKVEKRYGNIGAEDYACLGNIRANRIDPIKRKVMLVARPLRTN
jgi:hypothetical protein